MALAGPASESRLLSHISESQKGSLKTADLDRFLLNIKLYMFSARPNYQDEREREREREREECIFNGDVNVKRLQAETAQQRKRVPVENIQGEVESKLLNLEADGDSLVAACCCERAFNGPAPVVLPAFPVYSDDMGYEHGMLLQQENVWYKEEGDYFRNGKGALAWTLNVELA
ncbi:hypothetical protein H920_12286 [Fukomys damarensis]|uniref:Uncharacterized protein n=1 Tax=Fukomys damarensis TaxID=885580 RepID=A0A091D5I3_FUKDA|nr:hypothetical protein H920_12286 [Fukomys damarensis]